MRDISQRATNFNKLFYIKDIKEKYHKYTT